MTHRVVAALAARVRDLRMSNPSGRLSQVELGERMTERGVEWSRTTVAKLESGQRESVSVEELLALALVFDVPPVMLLADPRAGAPVPIAEGVEADAWTALLWMMGQEPLRKPGGPAWEDASALLGALQRLAATLKAYDQQRDLWAKHDDVVPPQESVERSWLTGIGDDLRVFHRRRWPVPPVPDHVRKRAAELGIDLPGQDG